MSLKEHIQQDMKQAMRNKETVKLNAIRMLWAAIRQQEIDSKLLLDDSGVALLVNRLIKQRKQAIEQYLTAQRQELADKENLEIEALRCYLPTELSSQEIEHHIQQAIAHTQASSSADLGKVMGILKSDLAGRCNLAEVSKRVKDLLT